MVFFMPKRACNQNIPQALSVFKQENSFLAVFENHPALFGAGTVSLRTAVYSATAFSSRSLVKPARGGDIHVKVTVVLMVPHSG